MLAQQHQELSEKIWAVADKLRGPYRPPQYRSVMLPMIVLRRLDCVLEPTKDEVLKQFDALRKKGLSDAAVEKALAKIASKERHQPLYNVSPSIISSTATRSATANPATATPARPSTTCWPIRPLASNGRRNRNSSRRSTMFSASTAASGQACRA